MRIGTVNLYMLAVIFAYRKQLFKLCSGVISSSITPEHSSVSDRFFIVLPV